MTVLYGRALAAVLGRVAATRAATGERFPLFAEPDTGRWTTTGRGSWTGGFWAGLLWLRARHTGAAYDRDAARDVTERLTDWVVADTATRGLVFWYGTALGDERAGRLRERAARACLEAYDPELGLVPWGSAFGGPRLLARVDGVPGMVPLLATVDAEAAESHLGTHLRLCCGEGGFRPASRFDAGAGWSAYAEPPPGWSRGRAWLLLAVAGAAGRADMPGLIPERLIPLADEDRPDGPVDTSAAAITAWALLKLGRREQAEAVLGELVRVHLTDDGRLLDGCYDLGEGVAVRHEVVWGTFFLACVLAAMTGLIDPREV
ncbi:sugar ABC transporter permease [Streptomyces sp. NPDC049837]|uniref:sugar ABC transporter permease n=1 Tax=Streptomyces sp. NPDC049837 TaxID=3155277 RepID=UPI0034216548